MAIKELKIKNFLLINSLRLFFPQGFNIFTGETGAGKSMVLGGLSYLLGERVDWELFKNQTKETEIEGIFEVTENVKGRLEQLNIASDEDLYIKRIMEPVRRVSRVYLNGIPLSLSLLREITEDLIDIHGQHEHQRLLQEKTHIDFLDSFAGLLSIRNELSEEVKMYKKLLEEKQALRESIENLDESKDYLKFQIEEIERLNLREGEDKELEHKVKLMSRSEKIEENLNYVTRILSEDEHSISNYLMQIIKSFNEIRNLDTEFNDIYKILEDVKINIDEVYSLIVNKRKKFYFNQELFQDMELRLSQVNRLKKKHRTDMKGLIELADKFKKEMENLIKREERFKELKEKIKSQKEKIEKLGITLSRKRSKFARDFEKKVIQELSQLGFSYINFKVEIKEKDIDEKGIDEVRFLLSSNKKIKPLPLSKVASGGELSRIMLGLRTVLSKADSVPGLVFDEIDVGIGGKVARVVGTKLRQISKERKVFCVTHLPQIAVFADNHFKVEKRETENGIEIVSFPLQDEQKVEEIARMLAGEKISDTSIRHAKSLIREAKSS